MQKIIYICLVLLALNSSFAFAGLRGDAIELGGYVRAGAGTNGKGGGLDCFSNTGAQGNEFRIGNECFIYGESVLTAHILDGKNTDPYFLSQIRYAFSPSGHRLFEGTDVTGTGGGNIVEAFVQGGRVDASPLEYWAGKRFYRSFNIYMDDWFYFMDMSGNGAGVEKIPLDTGTVSVATLFQVGNTKDVFTDKGANEAEVLDLRWLDEKLSHDDALNLWGAIGNAPGGTGADGTKYVKNWGWLTGALWKHNYITNGFNEFSITYGYKLLQSISLSGLNPATVATANAPYASERWRFVDHFAKHVGSHWSIETAFAADIANLNNPATDSRFLWLTAGIQPTYYFSHHWQWMFEAGHSYVNDHSEKDSNNSPIGGRQLTRFAIGPQFSIAPDMWARPIIRAYYAYSFWNSANQKDIATNTVPSNTSNTAYLTSSYLGATSGQAIGVQSEIWF